MSDLFNKREPERDFALLESRSAGDLYHEARSKGCSYTIKATNPFGEGRAADVEVKRAASKLYREDGPFLLTVTTTEMQQLSV